MAAGGSGSGTDRIDAVAIVTPNHLHFRRAKAFLEAGIHVICDKPLTAAACEDALRRWPRSVKRSALSSGSRTTTRAIRWCGRRARWSRPASSGRSASCRSNMRRIG